MMRILPFAAPALLAAMSAAAQGPLPRLQGQFLAPSCRQGECAWIRVMGITRGTRVRQGELRRVIVRRGFSLHRDGSLPNRPAEARIRWEPGTRTNYVFCSTRRPAYAFTETEGLITHYLDLFDLAGYQQSTAELYMRFCHGRGFSERAARALGYRPGTRNAQVDDGRVEDLTRF
ncbi:MAG TPA: hypothetical protein VMG08_12220 [Allosphingosinicella sp.]|nr:hypothetical protein [Allosphingosinicella sp.]